MTTLRSGFWALRDAYKRFYTTYVLGDLPVPSSPEAARKEVSKDHLYYMNAIETKIFGEVDSERQQDIVDTILDEMQAMARGGSGSGPTEADIEIRVYAKFYQHFADLEEPPDRERTISLIRSAKTRSTEDSHVPPAHVREYIVQTIYCYARAFDFIPHDTSELQYTDGPWFSACDGHTPLVSEPGDEI